MEKIKAKGIGGGDIAAARGLNYYVTPYQLWKSKTGRKEKEPLSEKQKVGLKIEAVILQMCIDLINDQSPTVVLSHQRFNQETFTLEEGILCVPDAFARLEGEDIICSIKNTTRKIDNQDDVPVYWIEQINYELGICGMKRGILMWLENGCNRRTMMWTFDEGLFEEQVNDARNFWFGYVLADIAPPPMEADLKEMYPKQVAGKQTKVTPEIFEAYKKLDAIKKQIKPLEKEKDELETQIKFFMADNEAIVSEEGKILATWKAGEAKKKFDAKKFGETYPELYDEFSVESEAARVFLFKGMK